MSDAAALCLLRLWQNGSTPRLAMQTLRRDHGVALTWEEVRSRFAQLSERF